MSTPQYQPTSASVESTETAKIRERIEAWVRAVRHHDIEGVVAHHAQHLVYFDVPPPAQLHGIEAYRNSWPPFFTYIGETGRFDLDDLHVVAGADVAFAHAILLVQGENERSPGRVRLTVGFRKVSGEWVVFHEHHSAPHE